MKAKINRDKTEELQPVENFGGELNMSLYDINKNFMASQQPLTSEEYKKAVDVIENYTMNNTAKYFMLLCKEISYYTIFVYDKNEKEDINTVFTDCINNVGKVLSIEINKENNTPEVWVRTPEGENLCMYYFSCDALVVPFKGRD